MRNISMFIFNFNYIKDLSKIVMEQKCNNIYCEAETDRYQIAKNSYNLRMPNDIFNSKTYTIFVFIISIMIFIYYHCILFEKQGGGNKLYYALNILLLIILLIMIIYRYVPNDDAGYLNYFKDTPPWLAWIFVPLLFVIVIMMYFDYKNSITKNLITYLCYILSLIISLNLMNIVMTFRTNTKPMLKTKLLLWSIKKSINILIAKFKEDGKLKHEIEILTDLKNYNKTTKTNIAYFIKIIAAFKELSKIYSKSLSTAVAPATAVDAVVDEYIRKLKKDIKDNHENIKKDNIITKEDTNISELSLIFDKETNLPITYNKDEHSTNANTKNADYVYTADISYDSPNLFYEKYWGMNEIENNVDNWFTPQFLHRYDYFTPTFLFSSFRPNLYKILVIIIFICVLLLTLILALRNYTELDIGDYETMKPLIMFAILIIYIISFISFNTRFNKYVVYKCLDSSYKRSLNKLNNITTPYIRLYDNKIVSGNKNYLRNYIITNVFYSLLNGNIRLNDASGIDVIDSNNDYYNISSGLQFANINSDNLRDENGFRDYYKETFENIYNEKYDLTRATKLYRVFEGLFADTSQSKPTTIEDIDNYFKNTIIKFENVKNIYYIIKKCFNLFDESKFNSINSNLVKYNNDETKDKNAKDEKYTRDRIDIPSYDKFSFQKYNNKIIPYKFVLTLNSTAEITKFTNDLRQDEIETFKNIMGTDFNIRVAAEGVAESKDTTKILDNNDEDLLSQASDIEKKQDRNLIKIIAKYLLILGHINYNRIEYNSSGKTDQEKQEIYEKKTYQLYRLILNTLYNETYDINDTFKTASATSLLILDTGAYKGYKKLTYIYNYLETKYVSISSNNNNSNYLMNIIKSINNKINDDDKTFKNVSKDAKYLFRDYIDRKENKEDYENEEEILNIANYISNTTFGFTYIINIILLIIVGLVLKFSKVK